MTEFAKMIYVKIEEDDDEPYLTASEDTADLVGDGDEKVARYKLLDVGSIQQAKPVFIPE